MKYTLTQDGEVLSYNNDGNKRTPFKVTEHDRIEWKRNGARGCVKAKIVGFSDQKPDHVFIQIHSYDWETAGDRVWIKKRSVLRVIK